LCYTSLYMVKSPRFQIIVFLIFITGLSAYGLNFTDLRLHAGPVWIGNAYTVDENGDPVQGSDVSPINFTLGAATRIELGNRLAVVPGIDFFWQEYLKTDSGKVVPTQIETGSYVGPIAGVLGVIISTPFQYEWQVKEAWTVGGGVSPSLVFRIPLQSIEGSSLGQITPYFFSSGRFFMPELQGFFAYDFSDRVTFGLTTRFFLPIYNVWDSYSIPIWDEMMILADLSIAFKLPLRGASSSDTQTKSN